MFILGKQGGSGQEDEFLAELGASKVLGRRSAPSGASIILLGTFGRHYSVARRSLISE